LAGFFIAQKRGELVKNSERRIRHAQAIPNGIKGLQGQTLDIVMVLWYTVLVSRTTSINHQDKLSIT
jgi:hypothetical protein